MCDGKKWKVVPVCDRQRRDVREEDLVRGGHFRICDVDRAKMRDRFPEIAEKRLGRQLSEQFVAQLHGCPLGCWYCYVTEEGVWGDYVEYSTSELVEVFEAVDPDVFHLMGGAPALYLKKWPDLIGSLPSDAVFHSDFLLVEKEYDPSVLDEISEESCLYAVNVKGVTAENFRENTRTALDEDLFWCNLGRLADADVPFYLTFTNPDRNHLPEFKKEIADRFGEEVLEDSFTIEPVRYESINENPGAFEKGAKNDR